MFYHKGFPVRSQIPFFSGKEVVLYAESVYIEHPELRHFCMPHARTVRVCANDERRAGTTPNPRAGADARRRWTERGGRHAELSDGQAAIQLDESR